MADAEKQQTKDVCPSVMSSCAVRILKYPPFFVYLFCLESVRLGRDSTIRCSWEQLNFKKYFLCLLLFYRIAYNFLQTVLAIV